MAPRPNREPGRVDEDSVRALAAAAGYGQQQPAAAEHERLLDAARRGDQAARESLTRAHLDWVVAAAEERSGRGLSPADLFQEGTIGLMEAIERSGQPGAGDFEALARTQVAGRMDAAIATEEKAVQDSRMLVQAAEDYERAEIEVRRRFGRPATDVELAEKLEWTVARTAEIGQIVAEARRRHDEELLGYLEPDDIDPESPPDERPEGDAR